MVVNFSLTLTSTYRIRAIMLSSIIMFSFFVLLECSWQEVLSYEPPKPGAQRIVLTLFKVEYPINSYFSWRVRELKSRTKFSTRAFAEFNVLGPPLGASFFNINHENEEEEQMINTA